MGRIRIHTVKKAGKVIVEKYYSRLTNDFQHNKRVVDAVANVQSKRLRNKIAGYVTHLMKRIQRGPVAGISFELQDQQKEAIQTELAQTPYLKVDNIYVDEPVLRMVSDLGIDISDIHVDTQKRRPRRSYNNNRSRPARRN